MAAVTATEGRAVRPAGALVGIARNLSAMLLAQVVTFSLSFLFRAALGRYLGDVGYGQLTFALSLGAMFTMVAGLGLSPLVAKETARARELAGEYLGNGLLLRLAVGLPLFGAFCLVVNLLKPDPGTRALAYLVGFALLLDLLVAMIAATFQGFEKMAYVSVGLVVEKAVTTAFGILAMRLGYGVLAVGQVMVVAAIANLVVSLWLLGRLGPVRLTAGWSRAWSLLVASAPFFVWAVFTTIYFRIDATMLSVMTGDAVTGWYGVAHSLYETLSFLPAMLQTVLLPVLSRQSTADRAHFPRTFAQAFYVFSLITPAIAFGTATLAEPMVGLIYPLSSFAGSVAVLRVLAVGCLPLFFNMLLSTTVVAVDRQLYWSLAAVACAFINPALNLVLIPHFQGAASNGGLGAAWATNSIELLLLGVGVVLLPRGLIGRRQLALTGRCVLAGAAMGAVLWWHRELTLPLAVPLGALIYLTACAALGVIAPRDVWQLPRLVGRLRRGDAPGSAGMGDADAA